jgi:hypothetical protein
MPEIKTTATDTQEQDKKCHSKPLRRVTPADFVDEGREQLYIYYPTKAACSFTINIHR